MQNVLHVALIKVQQNMTTDGFIHRISQSNKTGLFFVAVEKNSKRIGLRFCSDHKMLNKIV